MRSVNQPSTGQQDTAQFEQQVLSIANDREQNMFEKDANGHSRFFNLFNDTIEVYGDNRQEGRK